MADYFLKTLDSDMSQDEYEKRLFASRSYNTSFRCWEIQGCIDDFVVKFVKDILSHSSITGTLHLSHSIKVFRSFDVLNKRLASPYYEKDDHVGYRWYSEQLNISTNRCLYVEIHKDDIIKAL